MSNLVTLPRKHIDYAADALEHLIKNYNGSESFKVLVSEIIHHLRKALAAEPTKTPAWWRDGLAATLMREGVNKHRAREIAVGYWEAYCQIPGNETEADVLRDIGLVRITDGTVETADIHAIVDRQEALRRDAEQFRWMRENAISVDTVADPDGLVQVWVGTDPAKCFYGRTLDAAIVSAMAGSET